MNKILQIMLVTLLCTANYLSASDMDGNKDFQKKIKSVQKFRSERKCEKSKIVLEKKDENAGNKFLQLFNMGSISSEVISHLDLQSIVCLQQVCKKTHSKTISILTDFPLFSIDLENHKDLLQSCATETLKRSAKKNRNTFFINSLFFLRNLDRACVKNLEFKKSLNNFQKLACMEFPNWIKKSIDPFWKNTLNPIFSSFVVNDNEKEKGWPQLLEEANTERHYVRLLQNSSFSLYLDFSFTHGLSLENELFLTSCRHFNVETYFSIKLYLKNKFDVNKGIELYGHRNAIELLELLSEDSQGRDLAAAKKIQAAIEFLRKNSKKK